MEKTSEKNNLTLNVDNKKSSARTTSARIAYIAFFVAIAVALNVVELNILDKRLTFSYVPTMLAGAFFGPFVGLGVGAIGDLLGAWIWPKGAFNILIFLSTALPGFITGIIFKLCKTLPFIIKYAISMLIVFMVCSVWFNTFALWIMFSKGRTFWVYLLTRLPVSALTAMVNFGIILVLYPLCRKIIPLYLQSPANFIVKKSNKLVVFSKK